MPGPASPAPQRILVATDRSASADQAVRWAAELADRCAADLVVFQVILPHAGDSASDGQNEAALGDASHNLRVFAQDVAGVRGHARVVVDADPASAILEAVDAERAAVPSSSSTRYATIR